MRKAILKFPNSRRPKDFKKCMDFIDEHEEYFMSLSTKFWETQNKIEEILASYMLIARRSWKAVVRLLRI